jgi:putative colanic acid biosysnthesis UDP-glucose lipid carrier transferase
MLRLDFYGPPTNLAAKQSIRNRSSRCKAEPASQPAPVPSFPLQYEEPTLAEVCHTAVNSYLAAQDAEPSAWPQALEKPNCTLKRVFDVVVAALALLCLLPLLIVTALVVKWDTPGPVFFRQWRGGRNGARFRIIKFRTMTCMEDGSEVQQARQGDARVTRIGRVLRKTSIDELPQLLNVLRGDMSLVGPRPHAVLHDAVYSRLIPQYSERQLVKPGMTGLAQVNGCRGETCDLADMEQRVERDLEYMRHWSLWLDVMIMGMTVIEILRSKKAC